VSTFTVLRNSKEKLAKKQKQEPDKTIWWDPSAFFKTFFAEDKPVQLDFCGEVITVNGKRFFLVLQIYHSNTKLPFDKIEYTPVIDRRSQWQVEKLKGIKFRRPRIFIRNKPKGQNILDNQLAPASQVLPTNLSFLIKVPPPIF
jgi:hypothetical protein